MRTSERSREPKKSGEVRSIFPRWDFRAVNLGLIRVTSTSLDDRWNEIISLINTYNMIWWYYLL